MTLIVTSITNMSEIIQIDITHVVLLLFRNNRLIDVINYILYYFSIEEKQVFFDFVFTNVKSAIFSSQIATPVKIFVLFHQTGCTSSSPVERERYWLLFVISTIYPQWVKNRRKNAWEIIIVICSYNCMISIPQKDCTFFWNFNWCDDLFPELVLVHYVVYSGTESTILHWLCLLRYCSV